MPAALTLPSVFVRHYAVTKTRLAIGAMLAGGNEVNGNLEYDVVNVAIAAANRITFGAFVGH